MAYTFDEVEEKTKSLNIKYYHVQFPITFNDEFRRFTMERSSKNVPFQLQGTTSFTIHPHIKFQAFREKMRNISRKTLTRWYKKGNYKSFVNAINKQNEGKRKDKGFVLAVVNRSPFSFEAVGLMSNYNQVTHQTILDSLKSAGLSKDTCGYVTDEEMRLYVQVKSNKYGNVNLRICNGFTGTKSLNYKFSIWFNSGEKPYEFNHDFQGGAKRHLSRVKELQDQISVCLDMTREIKLMEVLENMTWGKAWEVMTNANPNLTKRQNVLVESVRSNPKLTAIELVSNISVWHSVHGYGKAVEDLLDPIMLYALGI